MLYKKVRFVLTEVLICTQGGQLSTGHKAMPHKTMWSLLVLLFLLRLCRPAECAPAPPDRDEFSHHDIEQTLLEWERAAGASSSWQGHPDLAHTPSTGSKVGQAFQGPGFAAIETPGGSDELLHAVMQFTSKDHPPFPREASGYIDEKPGPASYIAQLMPPEHSQDDASAIEPVYTGSGVLGGGIPYESSSAFPAPSAEPFLDVHRLHGKRLYQIDKNRQLYRPRVPDAILELPPFTLHGEWAERRGGDRPGDADLRQLISETYFLGKLRWTVSDVDKALFKAASGRIRAWNYLLPSVPANWPRNDPVHPLWMEPIRISRYKTRAPANPETLTGIRAEIAGKDVMLVWDMPQPSEFANVPVTRLLGVGWVEREDYHQVEIHLRRLISTWGRPLTEYHVRPAN
ncbi:hypothetical protein BCV70DRAFT_47936 [Testicularia cyperi]|uniref:Uncharacterized protein n=1 Tax=Testicularia cyperi TaxID=1882483 RepID=A0A317XIF4_9BASI|nr:hypothetical protein BCV70DRAFT_47936 [Testicularia cyperi]